MLVEGGKIYLEREPRWGHARPIMSGDVRPSSFSTQGLAYGIERLYSTNDGIWGEIGEERLVMVGSRP